MNLITALSVSVVLMSALIHIAGYYAVLSGKDRQLQQYISKLSSSVKKTPGEF